MCRWPNRRRSRAGIRWEKQTDEVWQSNSLAHRRDSVGSCFLNVYYLCWGATGLKCGYFTLRDWQSASICSSICFTVNVAFDVFDWFGQSFQAFVAQLKVQCDERQSPYFSAGVQKNVYLCPHLSVLHCILTCLPCSIGFKPSETVLQWFASSSKYRTVRQ